MDNIFIQYRLQKTGIIYRLELPAIITKNSLAVERSTVDYIGHYKGYPVALDAKECKDDRLNFKSHLREHQTEFLKYWKDSVKNDIPVLSGFLVNFKSDEENVYYLDVDTVLNYIDSSLKSITRDDKNLCKLPLDINLMEIFFESKYIKET